MYKSFLKGENLVYDIVERLGLRMNEEFLLRKKGSDDKWLCAIFKKDGVHIVQPNGTSDIKNEALLGGICAGAYDFKRKAWCPVMGGAYWTIDIIEDVGAVCVECVWEGSIVDMKNLRLGMVYPTEAECSNHRKDDILFLVDGEYYIE